MRNYNVKLKQKPIAKPQKLHKFLIVAFINNDNLLLNCCGVNTIFVIYFTDIVM